MGCLVSDRVILSGLRMTREPNDSRRLEISRSLEITRAGLEITWPLEITRAGLEITWPLEITWAGLEITRSLEITRAGLEATWPSTITEACLEVSRYGRGIRIEHYLFRTLVGNGLVPPS